MPFLKRKEHLSALFEHFTDDRIGMFGFFFFLEVFFKLLLLFDCMSGFFDSSLRELQFEINKLSINTFTFLSLRCFSSMLALILSYCDFSLMTSCCLIFMTFSPEMLPSTVWICFTILFLFSA